MKNSKGQTLPQPYLALAEMRREQQPEHAETWAGYFNETQDIRFAFDWDETPEKTDWWLDVDDGNTPEIPAASLAELEAWVSCKQDT